MDKVENLLFSKQHEWLAVNDNQVTVGVSFHAQELLGDIVYLELPAAGTNLNAGEVVGSIESVKAVSEIYAPISGTVTEVNQLVIDQPDLVNSDPYKAGLDDEN